MYLSHRRFLLKIGDMHQAIEAMGEGSINCGRDLSIESPPQSSRVVDYLLTLLADHHTFRIIDTVKSFQNGRE